MDEERRNQKESIWWKDLCVACGVIEEGKWFNSAVRWKLESGEKIMFWEDGWAGGGEWMLWLFGIGIGSFIINSPLQFCIVWLVPMMIVNLHSWEQMNNNR